MDKKELKKLIKTEFGGFLKELGFSKKSEGVYIKINNNIIQNITFELGSIGFTCSIAMQPLYIKDHTIVLGLSFGNRLSRFKVIKREWWPYEESAKGIAEIKELLIKNGLPWFEKYGTSKGIAEFISNGKIQDYGLWFDEFHQKQYLGFSLLYSGYISEGIKSLNNMLNEISENAVEYMKEYKMHIVKLLDRIKENPDDVINIFDDIIRENRLSLKI